ncbi:kinase domain protein, partial [Rhizoctonia solani AG-3 Rhs1AP]
MISRWEENGNLSHYISRHPDTDRCYLSNSICAGLAYLHRNNIVSSTFQAALSKYDETLDDDRFMANVLIAQDGTPMLMGFGNASLVGATLQFTATTSGPNYSLRWTAPEILRGKSAHTTAGDVYSLGMVRFSLTLPQTDNQPSTSDHPGTDTYIRTDFPTFNTTYNCIIQETFTSEIPFPKKNDQSLLMHVVVNKKTPPRPKQFIPERSTCGNILWAILTSCWSYDPELRPDAETVKQLTPEKLKEIEEKEPEADESDEN